MFVRLKPRRDRGPPYEHLQIVESRRDDSSIRQQVIATLGRRDVFVSSRQLDALVRYLASFCQWVQVVDRIWRKGLQDRSAISWGHRWSSAGCGRSDGYPRCWAGWR